MRQLRKKGLGYRGISRELGISKSTVSLWCADISLSAAQKRILKKRSWEMFYKLGAKANKEKRDKEITIICEGAGKEIKGLSNESFKVAGTMLYWAEGGKTQSTSISNSDPRIITLMVSWFRKIFKIKPTQLNAHLHIHYGNDELKIKRYWSKLTKIPLENFGKSFVKPKGTGHRTNILPNGVIRIRVAGKGSEDLRHRILAWADKIHILSGSI